ncbi:MAG: nucleotide exchange factor GrpE [Planctomycetota bacterium]|nr:nucleotide exchange factor GrpE [Planctomycetota bacterium]
MSTSNKNPSESSDDARDGNAENPESAADNEHILDGHFIDSGAESSEANASGANIALEDQLAAALQERDANHDRWIRTQAELENFRRRSSKELSEFRQYQSVPIIRDLLPAIDNLQRALSAAEQSQSLDELVTGIKMIVSQIEGVFTSHHAEPIETVNLPFDPNLHEAIQQMPSAEHPAMTIIQELEKGYTINGRVVRPSKVLVSSGPPSVDATG